MVSRENVVELYKLVLDRDPESDMVVSEKRRSGSVQKLAIEMLQSDEFFIRNEGAIRARLAELNR